MGTPLLVARSGPASIPSRFLAPGSLRPGSDELSDLFGQLEAAFSDCTSYAFEIIAADVIGDMAYTVGYEHTQASVNGEPRKYSLRATQVYRREDGEWKVAHRHADTVPEVDEP